MLGLGRWRAWLRAVLLRRRLEREMQEEMAAHLAEATARFETRGLSRTDASLAARREFGNVGVMQESAREARGGQWVDALAADLKYAFRYFARTPLLSITIVLTLALGIGFSSAVFSVLNGILTRPAPGVPDDPALVKIRGLTDVRPYARLLSYPELVAYAGMTDKFAAVAGWVTSDVVVNVGESGWGAISGTAHFVTPNFFGTLGTPLAAGRAFSQSRFDEHFPPELTAIVSHALAIEQFGGVRQAVGREMTVNQLAVTVIGVTPARFNGPLPSGAKRSLWMPLSAWRSVTRVSSDVFASPASESFEAIGRLQPRVALAEALPAVRVVAARANADATARARRASAATADVVRLRGLIDLSGRYEEELGPGIVVFSAIALLILLVCTTTVNSLLVGAAIARRYEIGVRLALGASRLRVIRQLLTEIGVLAIAGGTLGMWAFGSLSRVIEVARDGFDVSPSWATTAFTLLYAVLTAMLCGLSPALHATRAGLSDILKDTAGGTTGRSRLQRAFVVAQIAIAQPLMVALAAGMANIVREIPSRRVAPVRERVLIAELDTRVGSALEAGDRIPGLVRRLKNLSGVVAVLPVGYGQGRASLELPHPKPLGTAEPPAPIHAAVFDVPPGYFRAIDAPMMHGREFLVGDSALAVTPTVISQELAAQLFGSANPIGRRIVRATRYDQRPVELEVIGIVRVGRESNSLEYPPDDPPMFVPFRRRHEGRLLIRTSGPAESLIPTVMAAAREEAPMLPVARVRTLAQGDRMRRDSRLEVAGSVAGCGMIALLLASIGLYGMLSIAVGQRQREIGVRVALGAHARQVVRMFFASGLRVALLGLALGLPLSVAGLTVLMRQAGLLWSDVPVVAALVALSVIGVATLASWLPARRAATVDPIVALRSE